MDNTTFTIRELAEEFQITTRAIRFYEDKNLLHPKRKGRARIYSNSDRTRVKLILRGKRLGFSLGDIKEIIELYGQSSNDKGQLELFLLKIDEHISVLKQQQQDISDTLSELARYEKATLTLLKEK